ncbi:hypothetical protein SR914_02200 [Comamonas testosteroni]|uniref:Uncharacterized protein n=1 Tax=Comamonas testosteroni (strain DSM 14576 / KF-1) TaxID=399795 RepID=B7WU09_COMTK|nr:hypothetical protein [Comamonas testosteroni]EED69280.1 hypothetical protein CtesDRAFT_PD4228 [Comamonas testosteroni KF-1]WQG67257.1 hypothetical protein SR914_02200 [Comamonas testosteroni]
MPKNIDVKKRSITSNDKNSEGMKRGTFDAPIARAEAVWELCLPTSIRKIPNAHRRLIAALESSIQGQPARLRSDVELQDDQKKALEKITAQLAAFMESVGCPADRHMYAAIWLRMLREANCAVDRSAYQRLGEWRLQREAQGAVVFMNTSEELERLKVSPEGNKLAAYSVEELLLGAIKSSRLWPYNKNWQLHIEPRLATTGSSPTATKKAPSTKKRDSRPKRKTLDEYKQICGAGVIDHLLKALHKESRSGRNFVIAQGDDRFTTELSASDLLIELRRHQPRALTGADSTLRKAFAAFLSMPRGRPPKKVPVPKKHR